MRTARSLTSYPRTRHPSGVEPPDLGSRDTRARLTPPALRAFFTLADRWGLRDEDARLLLGGVSRATYYEMKRDPDRTCTVDELTRLSYLLGIFKALRILYSDALADQWVTLPNTNRLFGGRRPLDLLLSGGIPAMQQVRQLLDARRGL